MYRLYLRLYTDLLPPRGRLSPQNRRRRRILVSLIRAARAHRPTSGVYLDKRCPAGSGAFTSLLLHAQKGKGKDTRRPRAHTKRRSACSAFFFVAQTALGAGNTKEHGAQNWRADFAGEEYSLSGGPGGVLPGFFFFFSAWDGL